MTDIVAVLVVPADGDPGGLLAVGGCHATPPTAYRQAITPVCAECGSSCRWSSAPTEQSDSMWVCREEWRHNGIRFTSWDPWKSQGYSYRPAEPTEERALPLWWDGALVPEGWDRARRVFYANAAEHLVAEVKRGPGTNPPLHFVLHFSLHLADAGLASRVVRLARVDGRLVEVSP